MDIQPAGGRRLPVSLDPMLASYVRIAASKTSDKEALDSLRSIEALAHEMEVAQSELPTRIRARKDARGEAFTELRIGDRKKLAALDEDLVESRAMHERHIMKLPSTTAIIRALHRGLEGNISGSRGSLNRYHSEDRVLAEEIMHLKERLAASMKEFLLKFPQAPNAV